MSKHKDLVKEKFGHAIESLLYNSGGDVMWSLFKFKSGSVTIYYHDSENFHILNSKEAKWFELTEIADNWDPERQEILL